MRRFFLFLAFLLAGPAFSGGIQMDPAKRFEFTDCSSSGSSSQTVTAGTYITRIVDEKVWICYSTTCSSGGEVYPAGAVVMFTIPRGGQDISCRSLGNTGDLIYTSGNQ